MMSYEPIEQLRGRADEKVALFLTAHNTVGLVAGLLPTYIMTQHSPFWLRLVLLVITGALGVLATLDVGGMPIYSRMRWRVAGALRQRSVGARLTPEMLSGGQHTDGGGMVTMPISDMVRIVDAPTAAAGSPAWLPGRLGRGPGAGVAHAPQDDAPPFADAAGDPAGPPTTTGEDGPWGVTAVLLPVEGVPWGVDTRVVAPSLNGHGKEESDVDG